MQEDICMKGDIFDNFSWHSSIGIDDALDGSRRFVTRLPNTTATRRHFVAAASGDNFLVHKTTRALWKVSDDKQSIQPLFPTDVLTEEQVLEIMEENDE
jgi:hypothetical protein